MILGIFIIAFRLRDQHVFMWQSKKILNGFSEKKKIFFKKLEHLFYLKVLRLKTHHFHTKPPYQMPMLRQVIWWLQIGPITKNVVLPVTTLYFWKIYFSLGTSYKELICCTNNPNAHICTFCKRWSFTWWCFFSCEYS